MKNLSHIKNILFDCDGVLYSDLEAVFGQVSRKMTEYISSKLNVDLKKAKELQTNYFHKYNTSLNGLMIHHEIDPKEFLDFVHDIDLSFLEKDKVLRGELENISLNKFSASLQEKFKYLLKYAMWISCVHRIFINYSSIKNWF